MNQKLIDQVSIAVQFFWNSRNAQAEKQRLAGSVDQGLRGAVTGGSQMDGFTALFSELLREIGVKSLEIYCKRNVDLPGFFRPTKQWDLLVVHKANLIAAIEAKSQVGPSFGNNFNNRTEEAMGSALDLWTAYREGAFSPNVRPWLGYLFFLEKCSRSMAPVKVREPHFPVFPEFREASYQERYELFCRKLVLERHYDAAALLTSTQEDGKKGRYTEPASDLAVEKFILSMVNHVKFHCSMDD